MDTNNNYGGYQNYYQQQQQPQPPKKKKSGSLKKIAIGVITGLLFGVFAGLGFEAIVTTSDLVKNMFPQTTEVSKSDSGKSSDGEASIIDKITGDAESSELDAEGAEAPEIKESSGVAESSDVKTVVTDVTEVVKEVMPSVVSVHNKYVTKMNYFGQTFAQESEAAGSGIIVGKNDTELLLVTNHHVIADAEEIKVTFSDDSEVSAQLKGSDADKDLAVIAVQLSDMDKSTLDSIVIADLGDSSALTVGEPVVAIGNALGYGQSVTTGVVSALNRTIAASSIDGSTSDDTFIQTDAAINPGNSGGALVNMKGEVIGINSNKIGGTSVEGMGYAIPISDAKPIIEDLMSKQTKLKVSEDSKGYLGITGVNVEKQYSEIYGMPVGVYVSSVTEGTGADAAGLVKGDIIVALNGEDIETMDELRSELEYYTAGTTVELTIMQGSPEGYQSKNVQITLGSKVD